MADPSIGKGRVGESNSGFESGLMLIAKFDEFCMSILEFERHKTQSGEPQLPMPMLPEVCGIDGEGIHMLENGAMGRTCSAVYLASMYFFGTINVEWFLIFNSIFW
ncbi:hypothetical protein ACS0TY_016765 [Phlomoides rotata]